MEVIEDGNIMDRIPILLQRDLEYYEQNQSVLSETICPGVVGGRLDFPRNASFAAVKIVLWLEEEFVIAFKQGSGMFVTTEEDDKGDAGVAKTSDPDKFVQLAVKSSDSLLEHLHMLAQEALDHADLPVLTATLGAAALLKNSLFCYLQHVEDMGSSERQALLQACYKRYVTMSEAVAERVLDLHCRVLSLYALQDAGGRPLAADAGAPHAHLAGTPSVQGWWLYMNGSRKDLWDTVPPRMAQRIFAGMLNETLTILTVRYCQTNTTEATNRLLLNDILNILLCVAQLLPSVCASGEELAGLGAGGRDVRDVHAKCNELFKCFVYRGADLHFVHQAFTEEQAGSVPAEGVAPWLLFASPELLGAAAAARGPHELPDSAAVGLELVVLLAQPQPSWALLVKVLMMRNCHLARSLLLAALKHAPRDHARWPADGLWYSAGGSPQKCSGFLCTADGFCKFQKDTDPKEEYARAVGALTHILASIGSQAELKSTLCYALEISGQDWAACLDKRQVWCDRRPPWLAGILAMIGSTLEFIPPILVNAVQSGASMYQTMSLCLACIGRAGAGARLRAACAALAGALPAHARPAGGCVRLQALLTRVYHDLLVWARKQAAKEKAAATSNGEAHTMGSRPNRPRSKHVRIANLSQNNASRSVSFDGSHSSASSIALAAAEALCSLDEDDKHTQEIQRVVAAAARPHTLSNSFGLEDFPEFAELAEEGDVPGSNAERASDAEALTSQLLMSAPGRDSLRVVYDHLQLHSERVLAALGAQPPRDAVPLRRAPLLYIMFHIGHRPFDQFLRGEWSLPWSVLCAWARRAGRGAAHAARRGDVRAARAAPPSRAPPHPPALAQLCAMLKTPTDNLL